MDALGSLNVLNLMSCLTSHADLNAKEDKDKPDARLEELEKKLEAATDTLRRAQAAPVQAAPAPAPVPVQEVVEESMQSMTQSSQFQSFPEPVSRPMLHVDLVNFLL